MSYLKANEILPKEILELLQKYVEGQTLYIPKRKENCLGWGEKTKSKAKTYARNCEIITLASKGVSVKELSKRYFLAPKTISRIISDNRL